MRIKIIPAAILTAAFIMAAASASAQVKQEPEYLGNVSAGATYGLFMPPGAEMPSFRAVGVGVGWEMNFSHFQCRLGAYNYGMRFGRILGDAAEDGDALILFDFAAGYRFDIWNRVHLTPFAGPYVGQYTSGEIADEAVGVAGGVRLSCDLFWRLGIYAEGVARYNLWSGRSIDSWRLGAGALGSAGLYFRL